MHTGNYLWDKNDTTANMTSDDNDTIVYELVQPKMSPTLLFSGMYQK